MKKTLFSILMLLSTTAFAGDFHVGLVDTYQVKDVMGYLQDFHTKGGARAGVGLSTALVSATYKGTWVADLMSVCGVGTASASGQTDYSAGIGVCTNIKGLQTGILYDPIQGRPVWIIGISLLGTINQLMSK